MNTNYYAYLHAHELFWAFGFVGVVAAIIIAIVLLYFADGLLRAIATPLVILAGVALAVIYAGTLGQLSEYQAQVQHGIRQVYAIPVDNDQTLTLLSGQGVDATVDGRIQRVYVNWNASHTRFILVTHQDTVQPVTPVR